MGSFLKKASFGLALPFVLLSLLAAQATTTTLAISPSSYVPFNTVVTLTATVRDSWPVTQGIVDFCNADAADCSPGDGLYGSGEISTVTGTASIQQIFGYGIHNIKAVFRGIRGGDAVSTSTGTLTVQASQIYGSSMTLGETGSSSDYTLSGNLTAFGSQILSGTLTFLDTSNGNATVGTASINAPTTIVGSPVAYKTPVVASPTRNVVIGDFNSDGVLDLAVTDLYSGNVSLFMGNGDGTFKTPTTTNLPAGTLLAAGDFDRDDKTDIIVAGGATNTWFQKYASCNCFAYGYTNVLATAIAVGDFTNDGILDVVIGQQSTPILGFLGGAPNGALYSEVDYVAGGGEVDSIAVGDFNRDGNLDLAVISGGQVSILFGNGHGSFSAPVSYPAFGSTIAVGDFNGDGKLDLVVGSSSSSTGWVLFGNGDGTFGSPVPFNAGSAIDSQLAVADINNDGQPDIVFTNTTANTVSVLFDNEGAFSPPVVYPAGPHPGSVAVGDFNGDGIPDLVVTNTTTNQVSVLLGQQVASYSTSGISTSGAGTHDVLSSYSGDGSRLPSQSPTVPLAGITATPTVNVFCSPNPITYGSTSTCTTTVSGGATGTIAWTINGAAWTTTSMSGGAATASGFSGSPVGSYTIGAAYSGDSGNNAGSSSTVLTIQPVTRTVGVSCSPNPTTYGNSSTTCTATASAGAGSVVFTYNGGTSWITVPISGGTANAVGFGGFGAGTYSVVATAHGDSNYADGASGTTNYVINPATPTVSVSCLANPITYGSETSSCTTSVTAGATGTIAWTINGGAWTTTPVTSPTAGGFAGYAAGPYTIGVTYSGDSNYTSGSSSTVLTIQKAVRTAMVSCSPNPTIWPATHTTCTATVSAGGGSVNFTYNGGTPWGTPAIGGGAASIAGFDGVAAGTYPVLATASGDPNYVDGASSSTNYVVNKATPTAGVFCSPNPITYGPQTTTCTIAVGGGATGAVAVTYNGTAWASPVLSSGSASVSGMNNQPAGSYSIVANYPGDANNNAVSNSTTLTILQAATSMTGIIAPNPITFGQSFTVSGHVNCNSACGNLQYFIDGSPWGINSLDGAGNYAAAYGTATTGVHMIQVNYLGDANHSPSSWGPAPVTVLPIATTVTVSCSPNPLTYGASASCTAHVSGGGENVVFTGSSSERGPWIQPVDGSGNAVLSGFSDWPIGTYTISVASSGDANYSGATNSTAFAVIPAGPSVLMWAAGNQFESTSSLSLAPVTAGNANGVTAQMFGGNSPSGTVAFTNGGTNYGTLPIQSVSATNLFRQSVDMTNGSVWGPAGEALTPNAGLAPDGTSSATQVVSTGTDPMTWQGVTTGGVANQTFTASIWVKATGSAIGKLGRIWMFPSDGSIPGCSVPETAAWTRVSCTISFGPSLGPSLTVRYDMTDAGAASGDTVLVWGPQLEASSMPGPYVPTTSAAATASQPVATAGSYVTSPGTYAVTTAYGGDGTNTAASSSMGLTAIAASPLSVMTVNPTTTPYGSPVSMSALISTGGDAPTGALNFASDGGNVASASPAPATTTNYIPFSRNFSMWTWEATNPTSVEPGTIPGPNGLPGDVATVVFPSTTGTYSGIRYTDSTTNLVGKTMTFSFWARADVPSSLSFDLADWPWSGNFAAGNGCSVTTTWQRCSVSGTFPANANGGFYVPIRSDNQASPITVYLWGPQLEEGAAGPYVSTAGSARTALGGIATGSISTLPVGTHAMTATIAADSNLNVATSAPLTEIITAVSPTGMIVSCAPNPITYGPQTTTCTVSGLPSEATGTVAFSFNGANWANPHISGGSASASGFNGMSAGSYSIVAGYSGDGNYTSASASTTLTIVSAPSSVNVSCSPNPITFGPQTTLCTAAGLPAGATGTIAWTINGGAWTTTPVTSPTAGGFAGYGVGSYAIGVTYSGDSNYSGSISSTTLNIVQASTSLTVSCAPNPMSFGSTTSCTAHVSGGTGTVVFTGDSGTWPIAVDGGGNAVLTGFSNWPAGTYPINAAYNGDVNFTGSSNSTTLVINPASPTVTLACAPTSISLGSDTTCTATVPAPDGTVAFYSTADLTGKWWNAAFPAGGGDLAAAPVATTQDGSLNYNITGYPWAAATAAPAGVASTNVYARWTGTFVSPVAGTYTIGVNSDDGANVYVNGTAVVSNLATPQGATTDSTYSQSGQVILTAGTINSIVVEYQQGAGGAGIQLLWTPPGASNPSLLGWTVVPVNASSQASVTGGSAWNVGTYSVKGVYSGDANHTAGTSNAVAVTVTPVDRTISVTCTPPNPLTYGNSHAVCTAHVSAGTGTVAFTWSGNNWGSFAVDGSGTASQNGFDGMAAGTYPVTATISGDPNYNDGATGSTSVVIGAGPSTVGVNCSPNPITYGGGNTTCTATVTSGATGSVTFLANGGTWTTVALSGNTASAAGWGGGSWPAGSYPVAVTYNEDSNYTAASSSTTLTISKATPIITWATPAAITYPTPFGPTQETATANVPGTFKYSPKAGDLEGAGPNKGLAVTFKPTDTTDYNTATATVYITINKGTPTATWAPPPLTYGQGLTAAQLNAVASVPGTFTYFDALGTIFTAGTHTLNASFHPTNGPDYNELTSVTAILTVNMATPTITWPTPAAITYGTPLSATQLDAIADIQGDFAYAPPAGTILLAGSQTLSVTFTPTEHTADYTTATASVLLLVNKATPTVSVSCSPNPITYGPQNTSCTATVSGSATGSLTWTINGGAWTTTPVAALTAGGFSGYPVGSYTIAVAYSGDSNNIGSSSSTVLAILPAMTTTTITSSLNPSVPGQNVSWPCSVTSPDGTPTGMITYTLDGNPLGTISTTDAPWSGAGLTVGAHILTCSFAAQGNFAASSGTVTQTVGIAPTVTELSSSANPIVFGGSATFTALVDTGGSVAPTASVAFTSNGVAIGSAAVSTVTTTNLLNNSDVSTSTASGPTLTANASASPDGTLTATHVVFPANSGCCINIGMTSSSAWVPGSAYTYSVWLRSDSSAAVQVSLRTGPGGESDTMPTMTPTWTRYTISGTVPVGATGNVTALMYLADTPGVDYYAWGAQVEQAATAGPYVATTGAPATGSGGIATLTTTTLPAGNDTIVATYGGDAGTGTSTSNPLIEVVTEASPTITWNNPAPIVYGTPLSGTQLNATASVPGTFTYSPVAGTVLSAGSQTLSAAFTPTDSADYSTQTATVTLAVNKATLTITPNPASKVYGTANPAFTGTVTGLIPGDAISVGYTSAATTTTVVGVYSSGPNAISSTTSGPVNILGNYNYIQPLGTLTITQATTTLTWAIPEPITYGTPLSGTQLNATSGGVVGTFVYTPAAGVVLAAGSHTLTVTFTPTDTVDYSSATATVALTVNQATPTVTLTSSLNPANYGTPVTFTAQTAASATGSMTFYDGATIIGTGTTSGGIATYTTTTLATGSRSVTASYGGDSNYSPAGSAVLTEVITRTAATVTLTSTVNPSAYGETTTFTFTATGVAGLGTPSGTVVISDGATWLATPPLDASGVARFTTAAFLVGSHTLTAVYGGDVNYK